MPGEPVPFPEAAAQWFAEFTVGTVWGRPWGTTWFHITGTVPAEWNIPTGDRVELVVDLERAGAVASLKVNGYLRLRPFQLVTLRFTR